jgi:phage terminase large subunit-like protein
VAELVRFPRAPNDDDVDACTQALGRLNLTAQVAMTFNTDAAASRWR